VDGFIEHSNPILIQTFKKRALTAPTDHQKVEAEVRDSIGLGDRTQDDVNIVEGWCVPWSFLWVFAIYNGGEGKYMQVWKFAEVDEFSK
jgi:hypothetical protein